MKREGSAAEIADLEVLIGYQFQNRELLLRSLTHSSHIQESARDGAELSNEQMEFLGDAILGFIASEALVRSFPGYSEGKLSKLKSHLVSALHLHKVAQTIGLGRFLRLGKGEERSGGRTKKALLADALEAMVAAVYLDGGIEAARGFVTRCILHRLDGEPIQIGDYKSELQELLQGMHAPQPKYVVVRERGPEHNKVFTVQLRIGPDRWAEAEGDTKKAAQQAAARIALDKLREGSLDTENSQTC